MRALSACSSDVHVARVVVHAVVGLTLGLIARVVVVVFVVAFPQPIFCIWRYTLYKPDMVMGQSIVLSKIKTEVPLDDDDPAYQNFLLQRYEERIESLSQTDRVSTFFHGCRIYKCC